MSGAQQVLSCDPSWKMWRKVWRARGTPKGLGDCNLSWSWLGNLTMTSCGLECRLKRVNRTKETQAQSQNKLLAEESPIVIGAGATRSGFVHTSLSYCSYPTIVFRANPICFESSGRTSKPTMKTVKESTQALPQRMQL